MGPTNHTTASAGKLKGPLSQPHLTSRKEEVCTLAVFSLNPGLLKAQIAGTSLKDHV